MDVSVRFAHPQDADQIRQFIVELAAFQKHAEEATVTADTIRAQLESDEPPFECFVAEENGRAVGFAVFFKTYSTWTGQTGIYLEDLYVSADARSGGVGGALFRRLAEIALSRDCEKIDWSVIDWNTQAARFYDKLGARPLAEFLPWRISREELLKLVPATSGAFLR